MHPIIKISTPGAVAEQPRRRISVRLAIAALIASTVIALLISSVQIYFAYRNETTKALARFAEVETGYLPSLSSSLWEVNAKGTEQLVDSIAHLPDVGKVSLIDETNHVTSKNTNSAPPIAQQDFVLRHTDGSSQIEVGRLHLEIVDDKILLQLKSRALEISLTALIALLGNFFLVLVLLNRWISRPLTKMARFAADFNPQKIESSLRLDRATSTQADELDLLVDSFNSMQLIIKDELQNRTKIEQELRDHQEQLERLVEERTLAYKYSAEQLEIASSVAELGVWRWNIADNSLEWNDRMFAMYSQPLTLRERGLKFEHWAQALHPDDAQAAISSLTTAIQNRCNYLATFRIITPGGATRHIHAKAQIECDSSGNPILMIGINQDITDQTELQARLTLAKEQADAASAAKSSFLANMSHEIRTPLNAVLGMLQLVQKTRLDSRQGDYVSKARSAANSLLGLLNDILDYSKIEAGKLALETHSFELESWLRELAIVLGGNQGERDVELLYDIDPMLPHSVIGDSLRLKQILVNLAGNALKFTQQGHVILSIKMLSDDEGTVWVRFAVTDTGIGIDASQQQFIFEGFSQAEASISRRFGGTGLGLVICRQLVAMMGGQLQLESELGRGSRFWFDIEVGTTDTTSLQTLFPAIGEGRVLLATHSTTASELITGMMMSLGWQTEVVRNNNDTATRISEPSSCDLIVLDWNLPGLDVMQATRLIPHDVQMHRQPLIIMADPASEVLIHGMSWPETLSVEVITKPMTCIQLAQAIQRVQSRPLSTRSHASMIEPAAQRLAGLRLLVVEDNKLNREVAQQLLESEGAEVETADGGWAGVNRVLESLQGFDVVVMDMQMPDIDGLEATRIIRAVDRFRELPILAMTANTSPADREQCLAAGMNEHIGKPIDIDLMVTTLCGLIKPASIDRQNELPSETADQEREDTVIEDPEKLFRRFLSNADLFHRMLADFAPDQEILLGELTQQIHQKDSDGARRTLHTIKGSAGTMGAKVMALYAADLEKSLKAGDNSVLSPQIVQELTRLLRLSARQLETVVEAP